MDDDDPNWDTLQVEGKVYGEGQEPLHLFNYVSPGYFHAMGIRLVAGREFTWSDLDAVSPYIIVSEGFARAEWGSASAAIGKRVKKYSKSPWQQVIGVVGDVHVHGVAEVAPPIAYWPAVFYDRFDACHHGRPACRHLRRPQPPGRHRCLHYPAPASGLVGQREPPLDQVAHHAGPLRSRWPAPRSR